MRSDACEGHKSRLEVLQRRELNEVAMAAMKNRERHRERKRKRKKTFICMYIYRET